MIFQGFIGPSYIAQATSLGTERCINLFPEKQGPGQKAPMALIGTPGLNFITTLPTSPNRGCFQQDGRAFFVGGNGFYEFLAGGGLIGRGQVKNDGTMCTFASNGIGGNQLMITSAGLGYIFNLKTNVLLPIASASFLLPTNGCAFFDGSFISISGPTFQLSAPNDGTTWPGLQVAQRSEGSDNFVAFSVSQRGVWFFGTKTSEVWYDAGSTPMPLAPIPGVFIEEGIAAPASVVNQFDNAIIWLGQNQWGGKIVRRANGYIPTRISTHGVEIAMERYPTVADAVGWAYREQGHEFYILTFPTANATWAYDAATNMWHERAYLDPVLGTFQAQLQICHCYAFGKHLVGDRRNGNIYEQSLLAYTDNGAPIRSERRAPILSVENKWMFHNFFQLDFEPGVGLDGNAGVPPGINPMAMLKWSNDGGHTFSNEYRVPLGLLGQYETRAIWRRLGRSRNRVYDVAVADPVRRAWIGAYIDVEQGTN